MKASIQHNNKTYNIDLSQPLDISIPLRANSDNVTAWYVDAPKINPVVGDGFIGEVKKGGSVNFRNISFNPHGHGTHTECVGHIAEETYSINQCLTQFFFLAKLVTIEPEIINGDSIITLEQIKSAWENNNGSAIVIRTTPNNISKLSKNYSNTNPTFIHYTAIHYLIENGVEHLLIDTPSVDKEVDGGELLAHRAFWEYPKNIQTKRTITELIYVDNKIKDGNYFLNIQIASFENDASPSKPILYKV